MKTRNIGYWIATGLLATAYAGSATLELSHAAPLVATLAHLGYPAYLPTLLGTFKVLGVIVLLAPRLARYKEWVYAGVAFDLIGAVFSHASVGDGVERLAPPLVLLGIAATSWALRPGDRMLEEPNAAPREDAGAPSVARAWTVS